MKINIFCYSFKEVFEILSSTDSSWDWTYLTLWWVYIIHTIRVGPDLGFLAKCFTGYCMPNNPAISYRMPDIRPNQFGSFCLNLALSVIRPNPRNKKYNIPLCLFCSGLGCRGWRRCSSGPGCARRSSGTFWKSVRRPYYFFSLQNWSIINYVVINNFIMKNL